MKSSGLECVSDETYLGYHSKNSESHVFLSFCGLCDPKLQDRRRAPSSELWGERLFTASLSCLRVSRDINGLQCQEWRMVLSLLGAQSRLGRHKPLPALGFAGHGYVCMRLGTQEHIFPTRVAFNYTTASWAEAGILAKGFSFLQSFSQFVHLPLSWITPKTPKSNRICNDETGVAGVRKGKGEQQTHFSIQRFSLIKGCWL